MYGCDPWKDKKDAIERRLDELESRNIDHDQLLLDLQVEVDNDRAAMQSYASAAVTNNAFNNALITISDELDVRITKGERGTPGGVASLDDNGKVPNEQLPAMGITPVTEWSVTPSDDDVPSEKLVKITLDGKVNANTAITAGTKCKITYDSKGLVTTGAGLVDTDIPSTIERNTNRVAAWQAIPDDSKYPTEKLVKDSLDDIQEQIDDLPSGGGVTPVTEWSVTPSDDDVPSEKLVKDTFGDYLPLSGGTMTGAIILPLENNIALIRGNKATVGIGFDKSGVPYFKNGTERVKVYPDHLDVPVQRPLETRGDNDVVVWKNIVDLMGEENGVAMLDNTGKIPITQLPSELGELGEKGEYLDRLITPLMPVVDCAELLTMYKDDLTLTETPLINATGCTSLKEVFTGCENLKTVKYIHTPNVTNMYSMFKGCSSLTSIPALDTSNVTDTRSMFDNCSSLTAIPALDTSNVTNISSMFSGCLSLTSIPALDTSNVTKMVSMFSNCLSLTSIPPLDTGNVTSMYSMFYGCSALTSIPALDTSNVTKMVSMFNGCSALTSVSFTGNVVPPFGENMFLGTGITTTTGAIYVPDNLYDEWITATNWVAYADIIKRMSEKEV